MAASASATGFGIKGAIGRILLYVVIVGVVAVAGSLIADSGGATIEAMMISTTGALLGALLAGAILLRTLDHRPARAVGFPFESAAARDAVIGTLIGAASIGAAALLLRLSGSLQYASEAGSLGDWAGAIGRGLVFFAVAAALEEVLFRGYPFQVIARVAGPLVATFGLSALFALAHIRNPNVSPLALANIFLAGVMLSAAYLRTRSLWLAIGVHVGWNWGMASLLDLPVSGLDFMETPRYEPVIDGPPWLTGGAFGPEGGLAATIGFAIALVAVLKWPGLDETAGMRALRPLLDTEPTGAT